MGIKATWETMCKGCGKVEIKVIRLTPETARDSSFSFDIWSPGWPDDWMQTFQGDEYMFFCTDDCYKGWLERTGQLEKLEAHKNAVWVA